MSKELIYEGSVVKADAEPQFLSVLPLKNVIALPKSIIPVVVGRDISVRAVDYALSNDKEIFVTAQKYSEIEIPSPNDLFTYGTRAHILQVARMPNGSLKILIEGLIRSRIVEVKQIEGFIGVMAQDIVSAPLEETVENVALWRNLYTLFKEYIEMNDKVSAEVLGMFKGVADLDYLTDTIAVQLRLDFNDRQKLLEMTDLKERALKVSSILQTEIEILKAERNIRKRVQTQVEKHQKDYYLNEQIRAIQRELGKEDYQQEINELRKRAKKLKLSAEALEKVEAECKRLEQMQQMSPESSVSRNYIEWLLTVPWSKEAKDAVSLQDAQKILNQSHAGMEKAKERIVEFIAVKKYAGSDLKKAPIICLAGPPGVGKTSLAQSIADSLGRKLVRISLGGVRDEAEIRGHRRTYIGAMPGKIIQGMKKAGLSNPVMLLDEIDKMSADFRGDPAAALLEVLDPEQNKSFVDHFLEVEYDLSKVMFVTTANVIDTIPLPLLDRMEVISLAGYSEKEKLQIAKEFLIPKLLKEHVLSPSKFYISDTVLNKVINEYTKEAGVRQLDRILAKLIRKTIQTLLVNKQKEKVEVTEERVTSWLGVAKFKRPDLTFGEHIGLATGLAWTELGGDVLEIEVVLMKGKGALSLTGQLGEVMQESAQAALSYIRSKAKSFGLKESFYSNYDIHVHVPEGAIPKDGPSAGVTIGAALVSALTGIPLKKGLAMTGEVTLRGRVLAVGGLKEKLLAAKRFGITQIILPRDTMNEVKEFEHELDNSLTLMYASTMDEVIKHALVRQPLADTKKASSKKEVKRASKKKSKKEDKKQTKKKSRNKK